MAGRLSAIRSIDARTAGERGACRRHRRRRLHRDHAARPRASSRQSGAGDGVLLLYLRHTSASLVIQENADPDVQTDLVTALRRLAPDDGPWVHTVEGPDDMPAPHQEPC